MVDLPFQPDWFSRPGDTILTLMEQQELTPETLAQRLGCTRATIRGLLTGAVAIDQSLALNLARHVGGTPKFWEVRQAKYVASLARVADAIPNQDREDWVRQFPHGDIVKFGWLERSASSAELARTYLAYFGVNSPEEWRARYANFLQNAAFRTSPTFVSKTGALSVWLRQGEIESKEVDCGRWNAGRLRSSLTQLRHLTKSKNPAYFLPRLRKICAQSGVAVVFVPAPTGCRASGATKFITSGKAMVMLSFRYLSDDHFWFTFFHELGHLLLHGASKTFVDGKAGGLDQLEVEANNFSAETLVGRDFREQLLDLRPRTEQIVRFAYRIGVSPGVVVGQLQHNGVIKPSQMNFLKRRFDWGQIRAAIG